MPELAPGDIVTGVVEQIMPFGAFVRLQNGQKAMIHISQLSHKFVKSVDSVLQLKQEVKAKVVKIDERGRVDLSIKALEEPPLPPTQKPLRHIPSDGNIDSHTSSDDLEKMISSFMKISEEKNSLLRDTRNVKGARAPRRKGARP